MKKLLFGIVFIGSAIVMGCKSDQKNQNISIDEKSMTSNLIEHGKDIASSTFLVLSNQLQLAMKSGGIESALSYCNIHAMKLTDSLSILHKANIKRTSLKYRNPSNKPSLIEENVLLEYENKKESGQMMMPQILSEGKTHTFYAPIIVQEMCLKCHGQRENIKNYNKILDLYPDDLAIDYNIGDLRGMWSISFKNNYYKSKN